MGKVSTRQNRPDNLNLSQSVVSNTEDSEEEDEEDVPPPPVPDSEVYGRLQAAPTTDQTCLPPPPIAFSDTLKAKQAPTKSPQPEEKYGVALNYHDVFKDYIDIDKSPHSGTNNNSSDTFSFYSDNYMKTGGGSHEIKTSSLSGRESKNDNYLSVTSRSSGLDRSEKTRQSIYSTNSSSGISVSSMDVSTSPIIIVNHHIGLLVLVSCHMSKTYSSYCTMFSSFQVSL